MLGAVAGDVLGRPYEIHGVKHRDFTLLSDAAGPTDDTFMTCAVASAILRRRPYADEMKAWYAATQGKVPYGNRFEDWATSDFEGDSRGNGCAMRVSAIAWLAPDLETALEWAADATRPSHNHPESIAAAQATVAVTRLGIEGLDRRTALAIAQKVYGYDLATPLDAYREAYTFETTAAATVTPSLRAVLEGTSYEDVLRRAISMGGDADTMAAIAGGAAEPWLPVPDQIREFVWERLPGAVREVISAFEANKAAPAPGRIDAALAERIMTAAHSAATAPKRASKWATLLGAIWLGARK